MAFCLFFMQEDGKNIYFWAWLKSPAYWEVSDEKMFGLLGEAVNSFFKLEKWILSLVKSTLDNLFPIQ